MLLYKDLTLREFPNRNIFAGQHTIYIRNTVACCILYSQSMSLKTSICCLVAFPSQVVSSVPINNNPAEFAVLAGIGWKLFFTFSSKKNMYPTANCSKIKFLNHLIILVHCVMLSIDRFCSLLQELFHSKHASKF